MALSDSAGVGSALPSQVGVTSGWALVTNGTVASWASVGGGSGVDTLAAVGSSPNANGGTIASTTLTLQPADGTHPGVVTALAQTFGGLKTFTSQLACSGDISATGLSGDQAVLGTTSGTAALAFVHSGTPTTVFWTDGTHIVLGTPGGSGDFFFRQGGQSGTTLALITSTQLDLTGLGVGGAIKLKSPDGTTYTATIANGGTWSIS